MMRASSFLTLVTMFAMGASVAVAQDPSNVVFDEDVVATYSLTMNPTDWNTIVNDPAGQGGLWKPATMTWQGETIANVAVRGARSYKPGAQNPSLRIKFDEFVPDRLWKDLDMIKLDSIRNTDPSMMVQRLAFWVHRQSGVQAPRACHARLNVNGSFKGLYDALEPIRKAFVRHHWPIANPDGNLYEVNFRDFYENNRPSPFDHYLWRGSSPGTYVPWIFEAQTNEVGGNYADIVSLVDALNNGLASDRRTRLEARINLDRFLSYLAVSMATSNYDALVSHQDIPNNHSWYHREDTNRLEIIPWDQDVTFGNWTTTSWPLSGVDGGTRTMSIWWRFTGTKATSWIQGDSVASATYQSKVRQVVDGPFSTLQGRVNFIYNQIKSHVYADPYKPFTNAQFESSVVRIRDNWIPQRIASLRNQLPAATTVTIAVGDGSVSEPGTNTGTFIVSRTGSTAAALTVNLARAGTAINGTDHVTLPAAISIPAGAATATITLTPKDDTLVEAGETVVLSIAAGTSYAIGSPSSATITIGDDDSVTLVNNAQFISHTVPSSIEAGKTVTVTIAMKNTGTTPWTGSGTNRYGLGHSAGVTPYTWRERRVWLVSGETVAPNATKTFSFAITAPATAGTTAFPAWRMVQDGVGYFGTSSPALIITVTGGSSGPVTKSFQNGVLPTTTYVGAVETYLSKDVPTTNFGALGTSAVDGDTNGSGNDLRALLKWDVTAVPRGSTVQSARIVLTVTNSSTQTYELYRLYRAWSETQATWTQAQTGVAWQIAGADGSADRGQTVRGTLTATSTGAKTITLNSVGISMVQAWVNDPTSNLGVILLDTANTDSIVFASSEAATASQRPRLEITYAAPTAVLSDVEFAPADSMIDGEENPLTLQEALGEESAAIVTAGESSGGKCGVLGMEAALLMGLLAAVRRRKSLRG